MHGHAKDVITQFVNGEQVPPKRSSDFRSRFHDDRRALAKTDSGQNGTKEHREQPTLSRACLGKLIIFSIKWHLLFRVSHRRSNSPWLVKTVFWSHLCIKTIILPRQARDKHRESTQQRLTPFLELTWDPSSPSDSPPAMCTCSEQSISEI